MISLLTNLPYRRWNRCANEHSVCQALRNSHNQSDRCAFFCALQPDPPVCSHCSQMVPLHNVRVPPVFNGAHGSWVRVMPPTPMQNLLRALQTARAAVEALETQAEAIEAPHKAAILKATGELRARMKAEQAAVDILNTQAKQLYLSLSKERAAAMAAAPDVPAPPVLLIGGCTVKWLGSVDVYDPQQLPREVLVPDQVKCKELLSAGENIPGARLIQLPSFTFSKPRAAGAAAATEEP